MLRDLGGAAGDKAGGGGPAGLVRHAHGDRSVQRDAAASQQQQQQQQQQHTVGVRGSALLGASSSSSAAAAARFEDEFFAAQQQQRAPQPFELGALRHELGALERSRPGDWAAQFAANAHDVAMGADEAARLEQAYREAAVAGKAAWSDEYARFAPGLGALPDAEMERIYNEAVSGDAAGDWASEFAAQRADAWVEEFVQQQQQTNETRPLEQIAGELVDSIQDERLRNSKFIQFMSSIRSGQVKIEGNKVVPGPVAAADAALDQRGESDWAREFAQARPTAGSLIDEFVRKEGVVVDPEQEPRTWEAEYLLSERDKAQLAASGQAFSESELQTFQEAFARAQASGVARGQSFEQWVEMYNQSIAPLHDGSDEAWQRMEKGWQKYAHEGWGYAGYNAELYATYIFAVDNPHLGAPRPYETGQELLRTGRVGDAVLALEAEVQQRPENARAWLQLGQLQATNEKDVHAIAALQRALKLDASQLPGWLDLATSYTNENCRPEAFGAFESWLRNNPKYARAMQRPLDHPNRHADLVARFVEAARMYPQDVDADVQIALAVLFNISGEYDKAVDCLHAALSVRGQDARLWNKLGATLANSGQSERAVEMYHKALELDPSFIRARYNLGICCMALGVHREAVEHLLTALSLQSQSARGGGHPSTSSGGIWDSLRMLFFAMERPDLAAQCHDGALAFFRSEFEF